MNETQWLSCEDPSLLLKFLANRPHSLPARVAGWLGKGPRRSFERKGRLFAFACCRRIWPLLVDPRTRAAIEVYERYLDGMADVKEWKQAVAAGQVAVREAAGFRLALSPWIAAAQARAAEAVGGAIGDGDPGHEAATLSREAVRAQAKHTRGEAPKSTVADSFPAVTEIGSWSGIHVSPAPSSPSNSSTQPLETAAQTAWSAERRIQAGLVRDIFGNPWRPMAVSRAWLNGPVVELVNAIHAAGSFERLPDLAQALEGMGCTDADLLTHCRAASEHVRGCWVIDALTGRV